MALGEAQLVSSLYTPQRLGSIAQKLNDTNRLSAKNARKHTKTRENMRRTRKNTQNRPAIKRKTRKAPDKNSENLRKTRRFLPLLQESHLQVNPLTRPAHTSNPCKVRICRKQESPSICCNSEEQSCNNCYHLCSFRF